MSGSVTPADRQNIHASSDDDVNHDDHGSAAEYRVGPGHPPKQHQFRKGQSGNPLGARARKRSIAPDLKTILEGALRQKLPTKRGDEVLTKAALGISLLVDQFAQGDHRARRDLIHICDKLGIDLTAGQRDALQKSVTAALSQNDQELVDDFVRHALAERDARERAERQYRDAASSSD